MNNKPLNKMFWQICSQDCYLELINVFSEHDFGLVLCVESAPNNDSVDGNPSESFLFSSLI